MAFHEVHNQDGRREQVEWSEQCKCDVCGRDCEVAHLTYPMFGVEGVNCGSRECMAQVPHTEEEARAAEQEFWGHYLLSGHGALN
jgi:hypothetical protein